MTITERVTDLEHTLAALLSGASDSRERRLAPRLEGSGHDRSEARAF